MNVTDYPKRILLAATGLTPQILTETVCALATRCEPPFVPTEVHLVTTVEGADRARLTLLSEDPGWFRRCCKDYGLDGIRFDAQCLYVMSGGAGAPLSDIRTPDDNVAAADTITETVRRLTTDPESALHVCIAGGRKTMSFYLGYALSLFGRPQDRLSHVLVSAPFESHPDFYYPTPYSRVIYAMDNTRRPLDTREAAITLAEIPFVRLREGLPTRLLKGQASFSEAVAVAQRALAEPELLLDLQGRELRAGGEPVRLGPADFAFYTWFARRCHAGAPPVHWTDDGAAAELLKVYRHTVGEMSAAYNEYERASQALAGGMEQEYFEQRKSRTNKALKAALGEPLAVPYLIAPVGSRPHTRYCLALKREQIHFSHAGEYSAP